MSVGPIRLGRCVPCLPKSQRGVALVLVLWILLLVTISTGAYTLTARMDTLEAHTVLSGTRARMAAEAGVNLAVLSLRDPDELTRLIPDGRPYNVVFEDMLVEVRVTDERGRLDINAAEEDTLVNLLTANGVEAQTATLLAASIKDWSDSDDVERANGAEWDAYEAAGLAVGPADRPFIMVEELLQVMGMSWELYSRIETGLTVHSGAPIPNPAYAPAEALMALPDMNGDDALNFVAARHSQESLDGLDVVLPSGQVAMAQGRGLTYSIVAKATLPNGIWDQVDATLRLGANSNGRPYTVLRWREGTHQ